MIQPMHKAVASSVERLNLVKKLTYVYRTNLAVELWRRGRLAQDLVTYHSAPAEPPLNSNRVTLSKDGDGLDIDDELAILGLHGSLELSVCGIVFGRVDLGKSALIEFGEPNPMYLVKRRKQTFYSRLMKGLPCCACMAHVPWLGDLGVSACKGREERETYINIPLSTS